MKRIEIFKTGKHRDMSGRVIAFSEKDLTDIATAYDPDGLWKAPLVVGHPKHDTPAFGWVKGLSIKDSVLLADPDQVDAAFSEGVQEGRWPNRSASFYLPDSPNNPKPGSYYLRHVGFLGGQPPAVKGLAPVEFAGSDEDTVDIPLSFGESESRVARLFRSLRDFILVKFGQEDADNVIPDWEIENLGNIAKETEFSEPVKQPIKPREKTVNKEKETDKKPEAQAVDPEIESRLAGLEAREAAFAERQRGADATDVVKVMIENGQLTPAQADGLVSFMAGLPDGEDTVSFGEGDDKVSPSAFMKNFLTRLPKQVDFSELGAGDDLVDPTSEELAHKAVAYQEDMKGKGITITVTEAVAAVAAGKNKE